MRDGLDRCWNRAGVGGDATCERLAEVGHCRNCEEYAIAGRGLLDREAPQALQQGWWDLLAEPKAVETARGDSVVVFQAGGEYLALYTALLERITNMRPIHSVPGRGSALFTGVVNMDGELLPCFSAGAALHLGEEKPPGPTGRMLILHHGGVRLVCAVDRVVGVMRLSAGDLETPPVTLARNTRALTSAVFPIEGKRAGLLDGDKFVQRLLRSATI